MHSITKVIATGILIKIKQLATKGFLSLGDKAIREKAPNQFEALRPIAIIFWLLHPKKALYFFVLQKSIETAWSITKSIINKKI